jgi:hypothetical protein
MLLEAEIYGVEATAQKYAVSPMQLTRWRKKVVTDLVTTKTVKPWSAPVAGVGVLIIILALAFDYKYVKQAPTAPDIGPCAPVATIALDSAIGSQTFVLAFLMAAWAAFRAGMTA